MDSVGNSVQKSKKGAFTQKRYSKIANLFIGFHSKMEAVWALLAESYTTEFIVPSLRSADNVS